MKLVKVFLSAIGVVLVCTGAARTDELSCQPTAEIQQILAKHNGEVGARARERGEWAAFERDFLSFLERHPRDVHLHRVYQGFFYPGFSSILPRYEAWAREQPNDLAMLYLYGRLLAMNGKAEAEEPLRKALAIDPDYPWAHLAMVHVANAIRNDPVAALAHWERFLDLCPNNLDGYWQLTQLTNVEPRLARKAATGLRRVLETREPLEVWLLAFYDLLWRTEFDIFPAREHKELRTRLRHDLDRLRVLETRADERSLELLVAGHSMLGNKESLHRVEDLYLNRFPRTKSARDIILARWHAENPRPSGAESTTQKREHFRKLFEVTGEWFERWPDDSGVWMERFRAVRNLDAIPAQHVVSTGRRVSALAAEGEVGGSPPISFQVAQLFVQRRVDLDEVPGLVERGLAEAETHGVRSAKGEAGMAATRWQGQGILADLHVVQGRFEEARALIADLASWLERSSEPATTAEERSVQARRRAELEALRARLARAEGQLRDALRFYGAAIVRSPDYAQRRELLDQASSLWRELGEEETGWASWERSMATRSDVAETMLGNAVTRTLPDFELEDLSGRTWLGENLKGRITFVNVWATWCGPCLDELPEVQKVHDRFRGREDVLVLSVNIDENPGLIAPFVQSHSYTFPVLLGRDYIESVLSGMAVPINWIFDRQGTLRREQRGFSYDPTWNDLVARTIEEVAAEACEAPEAASK